MLTLDRYCNEDEDNDPNEEFEEILSCVECGDMGTCYFLGMFKFLLFGVADMFLFLQHIGNAPATLRPLAHMMVSPYPASFGKAVALTGCSCRCEEMDLHRLYQQWTPRERSG
jgi:hypothetical protein